MGIVLLALQKTKNRQRDDRATLLPGNESLSVREWRVSIQRLAEKAALKISTHSKAMLDNNESKIDSTHSQEVLSATEVAETNDRSESEVEAEPGDKSNRHLQNRNFCSKIV
jgi:hypothetical protein